MHPPKEANLEVYQIHKYLKGPPGRELFFKKNDSKETGVFIDADWISSVEDRRFTREYYYYVYETLVT